MKTQWVLEGTGASVEDLYAAGFFPTFQLCHALPMRVPFVVLSVPCTDQTCPEPQPHKTTVVLIGKDHQAMKTNLQLIEGEWSLEDAERLLSPSFEVGP